MPDPSADRVAVRSPALSAVLAVLLASATGLLCAQPYKQVLPDGRVVYSDLPPDATAAQGRSRAPASSAGGDAAIDPSSLPYALRAPTMRHPVVLYTAADCVPCSDARLHLSKRGIPFAERHVRTESDAAAFRQRGFNELSFPAVAIGAQRLSGFHPSAWDRTLDAAGYPKVAALPSSWRPPQARQLTEPASTSEAALATTPPSEGVGATAASSVTASGLGRQSSERSSPSAPPGFRF